MMTILKRSVIAACLSEGLAFLLVVVGSRRDDDVIGSTWYGKVGLVLHWPGMQAEDHVRGDFMKWAAIVGVPLALWFVLWLVVWSMVAGIRKMRVANHTPDGIGQPADGLPKPSV